jgi:UDP-N-acetylglucosamine 3-dehydrogenase
MTLADPQPRQSLGLPSTVLAHGQADAAPSARRGRSGSRRTTVLKAAVIGVGAMGRNHVRVYTELDDVSLVAVADPSQANREKVERRFGVHAYADHREMLEAEKPDLVTIAVPSALHRAVALDAIAAGVHVLVEKPLAATSGEAREIIAAADAADVRLAVGHVERFNPAVAELKRRIDAGELGTIFKIHSRRFSPFPARITDVGVALDLATHEVDVLSCLFNSPIVSLRAETDRRVHLAHEDLLLGLLRFENGALGVLDINWLSPIKLRELTVTGSRGMFQVNYLTQELSFRENGWHPPTNGQGWEALSNFVGVGEGNVTSLAIHRREPLRAELESFVTAVRDGTDPPVGGREGLHALRLAEMLIEAGRTGETIRPFQSGKESA